MGNERILGYGVLGGDFARRKEHFALSACAECNCSAILGWQSRRHGAVSAKRRLARVLPSAAVQSDGSKCMGFPSV